MRIVKASSPSTAANTFSLIKVTWDDYSYWTSFTLYYCNAKGESTRIGELKLARLEQETLKHTFEYLDDSFETLGPAFFSLGQNPEYYENLQAIGGRAWTDFLKGIRDIAFTPALIEQCEHERWLGDSLTRYLSKKTIEEQFARIIEAGEKLEKYAFRFHDHLADYRLDFTITPHSKPPSNLHVLTGRNGSGKTTTLKKIAKAILRAGDQTYALETLDGAPVRENFFSKLIYSSFSVFDNPLEEIDFSLADRIIDSTYIGLHEPISVSDNAPPLFSVKNKRTLAAEFSLAVTDCVLSSEDKKGLWCAVIDTLALDLNFSDQRVSRLLSHVEKTSLEQSSYDLFMTLSSGHAAVLYAVTKLVQLTEEKTVIIFDEPENHLHPPLLSAFIRAISELLTKKNGMAIISTHSPVVLQEVPASCVWKIIKRGSDTLAERPTLETFAENVGTLTHEVFGLEVHKSGFLALLKHEAETVRSYQAIMANYNREIGMEGRAILRSLLSEFD